MNEAKASIDAAFKITPNKSQVLLVALVIVALIALIGSMLMLANGIEGWQWFFGFSSILILVTLAAWLKAQYDTDLQNAHPTQLRLVDGSSFSADARALKNPNAIKQMTALINETIIRKPLPSPSGKLDESLNPIPNSEIEAKTIVDLINIDTQTATNIIVDTFKLADSQASNLPEISTE